MATLTMTAKTCSACKITQPVASFSLRTGGTSYSSWCRQCSNTRAAARRAARIVQVEQKVITRIRCPRCKTIKRVEDFSPQNSLCRPCGAAYARELRAKDPLFVHRAHLWTFYRMTVDEYQERLASQGGHCAICPSVPGKQRLHVDHDHRCCPGKKTCGNCVRGIVCYPCNVRLSLFDSDSEYAVNLRAYLGVTVSRS